MKLIINFIVLFSKRSTKSYQEWWWLEIYLFWRLRKWSKLFFVSSLSIWPCLTHVRFRTRKFSSNCDSLKFMCVCVSVCTRAKFSNLINQREKKRCWKWISLFFCLHLVFNLATIKMMKMKRKFSACILYHHDFHNW